MNSWRILWTIFIIAVFSFFPVAAQGTIAYGSSTVGSLTATAPIGFYTFNGTAGDTVTVRAVAIAPDLNLRITLSDTGGTVYGTNADDLYSPGIADARIDSILPNDGIYVLQVSGEGGTVGDYLLKLDGRATSPPLTGAVIDAPLAPNETSIYTFEGTTAPQSVTLTGSPAGFLFNAILRNPDNQIVGAGSGEGVTLFAPAGTGTYTVEINATQPNTTGSVNVALSNVGEAVAPPVIETPIPAPATTEEAAPAPPPTTPTTCTASPSLGPVNVRSGPGTEFNVVGELQLGISAPIVAVATGNDGFTWWQISAPSLGIQSGFVRNDVIAESGPCTNIPPANVPAAPVTGATATPIPLTTATYTPSYTPTTGSETTGATPTAVQQATATYTPSYTPTTPAAAQTAPEDARFNNPLVIPLDSTTSVVDFVSYPDGDREDRVRFEVSGMNPNSALSGGRAQLVIAASCFGDGTEHIQFFVGGQTYSCGSTLVDTEVTADSDTGSITITATGGSATYVQWVLTGTATRIN